MSYEYDVFLSYRRHGKWPVWVRDIFMPLFSHWLGEELGRDAAVFVDYHIETGDSWPQKLGKSLGETRVLVALFSRQYFTSPWCMRELQPVLSREQACGFRTPQNPAGLIVPASIHFPHRVKQIQAAQLQEYTSVRLSKGSITLAARCNDNSDQRQRIPEPVECVLASQLQLTLWELRSRKLGTVRRIAPVLLEHCVPYDIENYLGCRQRLCGAVNDSDRHRAKVMSC
jgi:hypothetical protein